MKNGILKQASFGLAALLVAAGCGGGATPPSKTASGTGADGEGPKPGDNIVSEAKTKFDDALRQMADHDKANNGRGDWAVDECKSLAKAFSSAADEQRKGAQSDKDKTFAEAIYNAGLAYQRCKLDEDAKDKFAEALKADPKFHRARVQLAMYAFVSSGEKNYDAAITELGQAVKDAQFQNVEALVNLAMVQMRRRSNTVEDDLPNDFERAKKNLQRALAIDDGFMPAFNQLALYYLESARAKAVGAKKKAGGSNKLDTQALELAALVCSQAIRKNAGYAPIHNTAGMIQVELKNLNSAVSAFNTARQLDPAFYEAQMNYAAVNLQFRGFEQAEQAYSAALKMRPNDFDAHLGMALARRGQINDSNFDAMVKGASEELAAAKKIDPNRPETYYNEAILTQEYKAKSGGKDSEGALQEAKGLFGDFIKKAGSSSEFSDAVKRSKERMGEIDQIMEFNKQTEKDRKAAEAEMKQRAAEAEAKGGSAEEGADKAGADAKPVAPAPDGAAVSPAPEKK